MSKMTPQQMERNLERIQSEFAPMLAQYLDTARIRLATTSTQEYMKDTGFTSPPFPPRKSRSGPLRILSGRIARSLTGGRSFTGGGNAHAENVSEIETTKQGVRMRHGTKTPYAHVHEQGFIGWVNIPAHTRTIVQAFGRPLKSKKTVNVAAHKRFMTIPARPFMGPSLDDNLKWLQSQLAEDAQQMIVGAIDG